MKRRLAILICLVTTSVAFADAPKQPTLTRYAKLWTNSVFTTKPEIEGVAEENPLEDYALGGISKLQDGYYAILFHRKKPDEKIVIYPGTKSDFEVLNVDWPEGSWKDAVVTVRNGSNTGTVKFEDKLLTVKQAPQAKQNPKAKQPPAQQNKRPTTTNKPATKPGTRTPRPRTVVKPNK
ncbi:MAG: hypothetical protein AAGI48_15755 [Verrucomicrobiota bacterium]